MSVVPGIRKRSIVLGGRRTSVSVEDEFWAAIKDIAYERRTTIAAVVADIGCRRTGGNLSSNVRLAVLAHYRDKAGPRPPADLPATSTEAAP